MTDTWARGSLLALVSSSRRVVLLWILFVLTGPMFAQQRGSSVSWMMPSSRHWYRYPAFECLMNQELPRFSAPLPIGLAGLFRQGVDPTLYNRDKPRFLNEFDLLSSLVQLKYPFWYLLDLPRSPELISVQIEKGAGYCQSWWTRLLHPRQLAAITSSSPRTVTGERTRLRFFRARASKICGREPFSTPQAR